MGPKMIHVGRNFNALLVTFFGYRSLIDFGMHFGRQLVPFFFPWFLLGSLLGQFGVFLAPFTFFGRPFRFSWVLLGVLGVEILSFYITGLHFYAVLAVYGAWSMGRGQLSRKRRRSAATYGTAC